VNLTLYNGQLCTNINLISISRLEFYCWLGRLSQTMTQMVLTFKGAVVVPAV
jgi:hypothetical protein